jgi:hypothetical protein
MSRRNWRFVPLRRSGNSSHHDILLVSFLLGVVGVFFNRHGLNRRVVIVSRAMLSPSSFSSFRHDPRSLTGFSTLTVWLRTTRTQNIYLHTVFCSHFHRHRHSTFDIRHHHLSSVKDVDVDLAAILLAPSYLYLLVGEKSRLELFR